MRNKFCYGEKEFWSNSMESAKVQFIDRAWGEALVKYLDEKGQDSSFDSIGVVDDVYEVDSREYTRLIQESSNGMKIKYSIWFLEEKRYTGYAEEVEQ